MNFKFIALIVFMLAPLTSRADQQNPFVDTKGFCTKKLAAANVDYLTEFHKVSESLIKESFKTDDEGRLTLIEKMTGEATIQAHRCQVQAMQLRGTQCYLPDNSLFDGNSAMGRCDSISTMARISSKMILMVGEVRR